MDEYVFVMPARVDGKNAGDVQDEVMAAVEQAIGDKVSGFVLDMEATGYLSSAGLRVLNMAYKRIKAAGSDFVLRNVGENIRDLLDVTGFSGYLPME